MESDEKSITAEKFSVAVPFPAAVFQLKVCEPPPTGLVIMFETIISIVAPAGIGEPPEAPTVDIWIPVVNEP